MNNVWKKWQYAQVLFVIASLLLQSAVSVFAADYSSSSFINRNPSFSDFGSEATSTSFQHVNVGGAETISTGLSTSTSFILQSGFLYVDTFTLRSKNWRWYDDDTSVTPTSALAAENTAPTGVVNTNILKLRVTVRELSSTAQSNIKLKLQYSFYSDFSQGVTNLTETGSCVSNSIWCYADGAGTDNATITAKVLSDADTCSSGTGDGCGAHNESGTSGGTLIHKGGASAEYEFTIKHAGARAGATYFFRVYDVTNSTAVSLDSSESYPSLTTESPTLTFTVSGVSSGASTEGVITDVTTTSTSIPFGSVATGTQVEAAHNLSVTTNATEGYKVYVYQASALTSGASDTIGDVSGTNSSPAAWAVPSGQDGAYGYHAGDNSLSGASPTRFQINDTYAKLESTGREIMYDSGPVTSDSSDVIYKLEITNTQPAGLYSGTIGYIVAPVF